MKYLNLILIFCLSCVLPSQAQDGRKDLKLISYNAYWGMKSDTTQLKQEFAAWVREQDPDIVAWQEMNNFTQKMLEAFATSYGHPYAVIVKQPEPDGSESFPVALTSKYPIINVNRLVDNMIHGLLLAQIDGFNLAVTHLNPFSWQKRGYEIDLILASIDSQAKDTKWLLMGDLNSVSPLDKEEYDNGLLQNHIRQDMQKKPYNQNLKDNALDYTVQQKILDDGFVDAFKQFYPQFVPSAPTKLFYDQSKYPLRYDYVYVSHNLASNVVSCRLIKDSFTDVHSDHYPVELILKR